MMRTCETPSDEGAGVMSILPARSPCHSDSDASIDGRAVTAEYDSAKACGEAGIAEGCAHRIALFSVSSVPSVVLPKPKFQKIAKSLVSVVFFNLFWLYLFTAGCAEFSGSVVFCGRCR